MRILYVVLILCFCTGCTSHQIDLQSIRQSPITVQISGEVEHPGVYSIEPGSVVEDVLRKAVLKETADISRINSQIVLKDKDVIHVPEIQKENQLVSINYGTLEELISLPSIGPVIAQRIIDYRLIHGFFQQLHEITYVKGIGEKTYEKIKDLICL